MQRSKYNLSLVGIIVGIRKLRSLKQIYIASRLDIDRSSYSRLEAAKAAFTPDRLKRIADCLETPVADMLLLADMIAGLDTGTELRSAFFATYTQHTAQTIFSHEELQRILTEVTTLYLKAQKEQLA